MTEPAMRWHCSSMRIRPNADMQLTDRKGMVSSLPAFAKRRTVR
jgi:hypothetical protein